MTLWLKLAIGVVLLGFLGYGYHYIYETGVQAEVAKVTKQAAAETAALAAKAAAAEHSHDQELAELTAYRNAHPEQPVRLCLNPVGAVRAPSAAERFPGAATGGIQPLPAGDPGGGPGATGPNIGGLLELLAARGDQISASLRERQRIEP